MVRMMIEMKIMAMIMLVMVTGVLFFPKHTYRCLLQPNEVDLLNGFTYHGDALKRQERVTAR